MATLLLKLYSLKKIHINKKKGMQTELSDADNKRRRFIQVCLAYVRKNAGRNVFTKQNSRNALECHASVCIGAWRNVSPKQTSGNALKYPQQMRDKILRDTRFYLNANKTVGMP